jgi:hypothetical protein
MLSILLVQVFVNHVHKLIALFVIGGSSISFLPM